MPRKKRIDYPGSLHHVIVRGINRENIFQYDQNKTEFLDRLKIGLKKNKCQCMAWVLMSNHFHLLIRTGENPLTNLMRSLLTSYAIYFNKKNKRSGYVYQGRYKDVLCDEESYLLQLTRYIHLNPIRAGIIKTMDELEKYKWSGHGAILGNNINDWQEINEILLRFGKTTRKAKRGYFKFVREMLQMGKCQDFSGGGVIRSYGGWEKVKEMKKDKVSWRSDDRILGKSEFVENILKKLDEEYKGKVVKNKKGLTIKNISKKIAKVLCIEEKDIFAKNKKRKIADAKALISYICLKELELTTTDIGAYLKISRQRVSKAKERGKDLMDKYGIGSGLES